MRTMPMIMRASVWFMLAACCGLGQEEEAPVLRVTSRLVQLSVVVHDSDGRPVRDLTRDDFQILDNGVPQRVGVFSVATPEAVHLTSEAQSSSPLSISNRRIAETERPIVATVILVDELNFGGLQAWSNTRREVSGFLRTLQPGDPVALYALRRNDIAVIHDFTGDVESLVRAAEKHLRGSPDGLKAPLLIPERVRQQQTLSALEAVAQHLAGIPGRKNLVWVSELFGASPGGVVEPTKQPPERGKEPAEYGKQTAETALQQFARHLSNANLAVYPIDPKGLVTNITDAASVIDHPPEGNPAKFEILGHATTANEAYGSKWATANMVAAETGGRAFHDANDVAGSMRRVMDDTSVAYLLGFYPDSEPDGAYHKLEVKVRRPGLRVRARRGYYATAGAETRKVEREEALRVAARSPFEGSAIGVTLNVQTNPLVRWAYQDVVVRVDPRDVRFEQKDGRWRANIDLVVAQVRSDGRIGGGVKNALQYALLFDTYEDALEQGLFFRQSIYRSPEWRGCGWWCAMPRPARWGRFRCQSGNSTHLSESAAALDASRHANAPRDAASPEGSQGALPARCDVI